jgi:hypothetical protein
MENKKAVLGLDTAKLFVLAILALVITSVVVIIVLDSVGNIDQYDYGGNLTNISTSTVVNHTTGAYPSVLSSSSPDCTLSISKMYNSSSGTEIPSTNYTLTGCLIKCTDNTACAKFNNSIWNITGTFTTSSKSKLITQNTTSAMSDLMADTGTWFTLIGVVIIILIIASVIMVVNRLGGRESMSGESYAPNI